MTWFESSKLLLSGVHLRNRYQVVLKRGSMDNNEVDELQQDLREHIRAFTRARVSVVCSTASRPS
jgi:hypothetical protein